MSLLSPDAHAAALLAMRAYGREPMSMTHGDFDSDYLRALVLGPDGRRRLRRVSFAAHFDSLMRGRRGIPRPRSEAELNPYRARFAAMFGPLRRAYGVRSYLAHSMTVTPQNLPEVADTVAAVPAMGYSMMSFQPAARVGDDRRWSDDLDEATIDDVWKQIEAGVGDEVAWQAVQIGDPRCNRTAFGLTVDGRWYDFLDPGEPGDLAARDWFYAHLGGMDFVGTPRWLVVLKLLRCVVEHPSVWLLGSRYVRRLVRRVGGLRSLVTAAARRRVAPLTFVVHHFMNAEDVRPAWELLEAGIQADDPKLLATQERLQACVYAMAHPETGRLIPACVQHSVLDPAENQQLRRLLPTGGNGGGGICAARHLANHGGQVTLVVSDVARLAGVPAEQLALFRASGGRLAETGDLRTLESSLTVDAVLGYSLAGAPTGAVADLITWMSLDDAPVVALDVPSGVDSTTGDSPGDTSARRPR